MEAQPLTSRLMVLAFTDIVSSVQSKARMGATTYSRMLAWHDALCRTVVAATPNAQIVTDTGDGFLLRFETPSDAVAAMLRFSAALRLAPWAGERPEVRIGIHLGEAFEVDETRFTGKRKLVGLAVDIAARVMSLALPGQMLLTRAAFDNARQNVREHPGFEGMGALESQSPDGQRVDVDLPGPDAVQNAALRWMAHGPYRFKGSDEPIEVYEVGVEGVSPLRAPPSSEKVERAVLADDEGVLGWRPAIGLEVPHRTYWIIERKLGEGGFGEVWLGRHAKTRQARVFKFCFDAERLRSFKRELTLFRLLREALGERKDIARLFEMQLDESPYYLESEFTEHGDLADWAVAQGGIRNVPLNTRLDIVARTADAAAAAHSVGILHKDIKPSNILVFLDDNNEPRPRLADFGIGVITDRRQLESRDITVTGITEGLLDGAEASRTGTRMYAPPESLIGEVFTVQGDIYAIGVLLYQMAIGDLYRPLAPGWERDISDPILRQDIADCVAGDRGRRLTSAAELARRLRDLPRRRRAARTRRLLKAGAAASAALAVMLAVVAFWLLSERELRQRAEAAEARAEDVTARSVQAIGQFLDDFVAKVRLLEGSTEPQRILVEGAIKYLNEVEQAAPNDPRIRAVLADGYYLMGGVQGGKRQGNLGDHEASLNSHEHALRMREALIAEQPGDAALVRAAWQSRMGIGDALDQLRRYPEALTQYESALTVAREQAASRPDDAETLQNLARAQQSVSDTLRRIDAAGHAERIESLFQESYKIRRDLVARRPDDRELLRDLTTAQIRLAFQLTGQKLFAEARTLLEEAVMHRQRVAELTEKVVAVGESATAQRDLAIARIYLAECLIELDQPAQAVDQARRSLDVIRELQRADPQEFRYPRDAVWAAVTLGKAHAGAGDNDAALAAYREASTEVVRIANAADAQRTGSLVYVVTNFLLQVCEGLEAVGDVKASTALTQAVRARMVALIEQGGPEEDLRRAIDRVEVIAAGTPTPQPER